MNVDSVHNTQIVVTAQSFTILVARVQVYFAVLPVFQLERHILDIFYKIQLEMDDISCTCVSHATGMEKMSEDKLNDLHTSTDILILMHPERKDAFETVQLHTFF